MGCVLPPPIDDSNLLAYLDGTAGDGVADHLARCPHCLGRAEALSSMEQRLLGKLYRVTCPPSEVLGEYHLGMLLQDQSREVERHLSRCHFCVRELEELRSYLADLTPDVEHGFLEGVHAQVRVWIASLVEGVTGIGLALQGGPAVAGIRGQDGGPRLYQAGPLQVSVETQEDTRQPDLRSLLGLLIGAVPVGFRVAVWCEGDHLMTVPIDQLGNFEISGLAVGRYDLILSSPQVEVHIQDLVVT